MSQAADTEQVPAAHIKDGDRLDLWGATFIVTRVEYFSGQVRLHLDRERIGFIERGAWSPILLVQTRLNRITQP